MKNKTLIIFLSLLMVFGLVLFLVINVSAKEEYFNQVELSNNNIITNSEGIAFYDTIISVGLDYAGIYGVNVVVSELTDGAKEQFSSGELKAHVRYFNGVFYLFLDKFNRREAIEVISHEIIHIIQYNSGQLVYENSELYWEGQKYDLENMDYENRPWEREAFSRETDLGMKVYNELYNKN
jgi:predicted metallopeptidase